MPTFDTIAAVAAAGFAMSAVPGPSMLYVLSRSVGQSRAAGFASAVGLCLGGIILAIATAFGLAAVFRAFPILITILSYAGTVYLLWLGVVMIITARNTSNLELTVSRVQEVPILSIIRQGIIVEVLNPKTVLFFALFLPPFVDAGEVNLSALDATLHFLFLGSLVPLTAIPSDLLVAFLGGSLAKAINQGRRTRMVMAIASGAVLVLIAISLQIQSP